MEPGKQTLDLPTSPVAAQHAAILCGFPAAHGAVRGDQLHAEALANLRVQRVAIVSAITDQSLGSFGEEAVT